MAYGLYLYKEIESKSGKTIRLEIFQKDYSGSSIEIESMSGVPLTLVSDNANSGVYLPIVKSFLNINIIDTEQIDYSVFFTPDATKFKVLLKVNGTLEWSGYLTPDSFSQSLQYKSEINLVARDNLGMLSEFDFDLTNTFYSISTLINTALTRIGFQFTLETRTTKVDSANETIVNGLTQSKFWVGKNWQEVLETILTGIGCQLRYVGGNKYAIFDIGNLSSLGTTEVAQPFIFIEQSGIQEIVPAWKVITINQDYGKVDNSYDGFIEEASFGFNSNKGGDENNPYNFYTRPYYTISLSSDWGSTIPMLNPYEYPNLDPNDIYITGKSPATTLFMGQGLTYGKYFEAINDGKAIQFKFKASNYPYYITRRRSGEYMVEPMLRARYLYEMKVRCNLFAQTATDKYVLQGRNWIIWTAGYSDALEFTLPQTKESGVYGKQGTELTSQMDSPQEQDITIEAYGLGVNASVYIEFYPYTATYTEVDGLGNVDDYPAIVYDVHTMKLSSFEVKIVENEFGGLETKATLNADHNINGGIELALGQVPRGLGGYHTYLGGIFKNSNPYYPPMYDFHFTGGVNYTLSELVGREIAHHYKTQRKKLSGNIINSENFAAMPSFAKPFTDGTLTYALNYGSLDFRNEVMSVELIEVEDYTTEDYTFIEATIDTGGTSLGSGETEFIQWSAAGNAKRIYELDTASEADQGGAFVFIDKSGLTAAKKVPISSLLVDAYTKTESDSRFASIDGDLTQDFSAKKLTTATLLLPQSAPTLATGEMGLYALDSGFSGETPSGAGTLTSVALTMPTGFSVSGSPITESGTFGVTFANGYRMFTETEIGNKIESSLIGAANGIAPLDSGGKVALQYLPSTLLKYMGVWNASTNTPTLTSPDTNRKGQVWNVSVAGTQFGLDFKLGDWLIYNDSGVAEKSDNSDDVTSVNGYTGAVTLKTSDIAEQTNLYYTNARVKTYADTLYTPLAHASATNNPHSVTAVQVGALPLSGGTLTLDGVISKKAYVGGAWARNILRFENSTASIQAALGAFGASDSISYMYLGFNAVDSNNLRVYSDKVQFGNSLIYHSGNLLNIGTTASSARTALELGSAALKSDTYFALLAGNISQPFSASKLASTTLLLPQTTPSLASGEMAIYGLESGFSGETPSGAGSVTSISMVVPTGLSVTPATITESGTFTISYASGYSIPTNIKQSEWDNAYTLRHNAVTLGTANGLSLSTQELSLGLASTTTNGALSSTDWNTFNGKQAKLIGTGASSLVRVNASGVIAYDDSTYLTGNQAITLSGVITGSGTTAITTAIADNALSIAKTNGLQSALDAKMATASYPDLVAIEALTGTSGFLKKTAANTWGLDTNSYALISGATTQDFQAKNLTLAGSITGATTITASSTIQATTAKLTNLTDGYIPYHISDASGLGNSPIMSNGTSVTIGNIALSLGASFEIIGSRNATRSLLFALSKYDYGTTYFYQNYSNTYFTSGKSLEIELTSKNMLVLATSNTGDSQKVVFPNGNIEVLSTTQSTAYKNGSLVLSGGLGIAKDLYSNGKGVFASTVSATSFTSGGNAVIHAGNIGSQSVNYATSAGNADTLDNQHASYFATAAQMNAANLSNGYLPYWNGSSLGNSVIYQDNGNIGIGTTDLSSHRLKVSRDADSPTRICVNNQSDTANALSGILLDSWGGSWTIDVPYSSTYINPLIFKFAGADERVRFMSDGRVDIGYSGTELEKLAVNGTTKFNGNSQVIGSLTMTENINTNLRIPKVAPTNPTSGQYYFYIVE